MAEANCVTLGKFRNGDTRDTIGDRMRLFEFDLCTIEPAVTCEDFFRNTLSQCFNQRYVRTFDDTPGNCNRFLVVIGFTDMPP